MVLLCHGMGGQDAEAGAPVKRLSPGKRRHLIHALRVARNEAELAQIGAWLRRSRAAGGNALTRLLDEATGVPVLATQREARA